jgi:hypothetical protein
MIMKSNYLFIIFIFSLIFITGCSDLMNDYPILIEGSPGMIEEYDELKDYRIVEMNGDFIKIAEASNNKIIYKGDYEFTQGQSSKIGFYCEDTGEKAKEIIYKKGDMWSTKILDCGDVYLILYSSSAGKGPVWGPFYK